MIRDIHLQWDDQHGDCYECDLPAAWLVELYPNQPEGDRNETLCSVCAAHHAFHGDRIVGYLFAEEEQ